MTLRLAQGTYHYELTYFVLSDTARMVNAPVAATAARERFSGMGLSVAQGTNPRVDVVDVPLSSYRVTLYATFTVPSTAGAALSVIDAAAIDALRTSGWQRTSARALQAPIAGAQQIASGFVSVNPLAPFGQVSRRVTPAPAGTTGAPPPLPGAFNRVVGSSDGARVGQLDSNPAGAIVRAVENAAATVTHPSPLVIAGTVVVGVVAVAVAAGYAYRSFK